MTSKEKEKGYCPAEVIKPEFKTRGLLKSQRKYLVSMQNGCCINLYRQCNRFNSNAIILLDLILFFCKGDYSGSV